MLPHVVYYRVIDSPLDPLPVAEPVCHFQLALPAVALTDIASAWKSGPVRFFGPKFRDRDWDQSAFILEPKKTRPDRKKPKTVVLDQS